MAEEKNTGQPKFSDYLYILYKWKKLLFINMFIIIVGATVYSFLIPEQFKATSTVMVSQGGNNIGGLSSLIGNSNIASLGAQLLGGSNPSQDVIFGILSSRTA